MIRLTGPSAGGILADIFQPAVSHAAQRTGTLQLGHLVDGDRPVDEVIVCRTPGCVEINIHGGPAAARAALRLLSARGAAVQPPALAAIDTFAVAHPHGDNPAIAAEMLEALARARSPLVCSALSHQWSAGISALAGRDDTAPEQYRRAAAGLGRMKRLLDPAEVVLIGPPNAGKSALANALVGRQVSIVHDTPGTTRDWVREEARLDGVPIYLTDTAGIWSAPAAIDAEAVRRARARAETADLVVLLSAETAAPPHWLHARDVLRITAKCDLSPAAGGAPPHLRVSARSGEGLAALRAAILEDLGLSDLDPTSAMAFTARQADLLARAAAYADHGQTDLLRRTREALLLG